MDTLLRALKARNIALGEDDVKWAFESPATRDGISAWVDEYIHNDTLLSNDEQKLAHRLSRLKKQPGSEPKRRVTDEELRCIIEDLERSTEAIRKHQTVLEKQKAALQKFRNNESEDTSSTRQEASHGTLRTNAQKISETSQELGENISLLSDRASSATQSLAAYATQRLESDDKALDTIVSMDIRHNSRLDIADVKAVEQWCRSLIAFRTAEVKARVDELYYSKLVEASAGLQPTEHDREDKAALRSELDSLREEIPSMSQMVVDNELRKPILDGLEAIAKAQGASRTEWLGYIESALIYMTARAAALSYHAQNIHAFQAVLSEIESVFRPFGARDLAGLSHGRTGTDAASLPGKPTRTFSGSTDGTQPARLLQMLNADLYEVEGSTRSDLEKLLRGKRERSQRQQLASETSTLQTLGGHLDAQARSTDLALDALYSHTQFNTKSLSNRELDAELQRIEQAVGKAGANISAVEAAQAEPLPRGPANVVHLFGS